MHHLLEDHGLNGDLTLEHPMTTVVCPVLSRIFDSCIPMVTAEELEAQEKPFGCGVSGQQCSLCLGFIHSLLAGISACPAVPQPSHCSRYCGTLRDEAAGHASLLGNSLLANDI